MDPAERGKVRHAGWEETTRVSSHGPMVEVTGQRHSAIEGHPLAIQNLLHANRRRGIYPHHGRPKFVVIVDGWPVTIVVGRGRRRTGGSLFKLSSAVCEELKSSRTRVIL